MSYEKSSSDVESMDIIVHGVELHAAGIRIL